MQQLIRYGLIGIASNIIVYIIYLWITYLGVSPKTAMSLVYLTGASIGFIGNRKLTFSYRGNITWTALRYTMAHLFGYLLNFLILFVFVDQLGYFHQWIQIVAIIIVAAFLFIVFKYFVFPKKHDR
jgi:putative flippase GtrA